MSYWKLPKMCFPEPESLTHPHFWGLVLKCDMHWVSSTDRTCVKSGWTPRNVNWSKFEIVWSHFHDPTLVSRLLSKVSKGMWCVHQFAGSFFRDELSGPVPNKLPVASCAHVRWKLSTATSYKKIMCSKQHNWWYPPMCVEWWNAAILGISPRVQLLLWFRKHILGGIFVHSRAQEIATSMLVMGDWSTTHNH